MAEFKTAEQYVVDRLETTERELETAKATRLAEMQKVMDDLSTARAELTEVVHCLSVIRDNLRLGSSELCGKYMTVDYIWRKDNPEQFDALLDILGIEPPDEEDEE